MNNYKKQRLLRLLREYKKQKLYESANYNDIINYLENQASIEELEELKDKIIDIIMDKEKQKQPTPINFKKQLGVELYNGGWCRKVTGIDKTKKQGYSILGPFINGWKYLAVQDPGVYVVCDVEGSRKHPSYDYILFTWDGQNLNIVKTLEDAKGEWAVQLWPYITKQLAKFK